MFLDFLCTTELDEGLKILCCFFHIVLVITSSVQKSDFTLASVLFLYVISISVNLMNLFPHVHLSLATPSLVKLTTL